MQTSRSSAAMSQPVMRRHNLSLALRTVRELGATSRSDLAAWLGLSKPAVTRIVGELIELGYLAEGRSAEIAGRGRPRTILKIRPGVSSVIGVDFRIDRIVIQSVDFSGDVLQREQLPQPQTSDINQIVEILAQSIERVATSARLPVRGIGLSVPAELDSTRTTVLDSLYLDWRNVALPELLANRLGPECPRIYMDGVAQCAALANYAEFPNKSDLVLAHIQIGMGAGIGFAKHSSEPLASNHRNLRIAHLPMSPGGPRCACGADGCLDAVAGFPALVRASRACDIPLSDSSTAMASYCQALLELDRSGNVAARKAITEVATWLGRAAASVLNLCEPGRLTIGGYPLYLGKPFRDAFMDAAIPYAPKSSRVISATSLGDNASIAGAALLGIQAIIDDPLAESEQTFKYEPSTSGTSGEP